MNDLKVGDCVEVLDPGLAMLRIAMSRFQSDIPPNHIGEIHEIRDDECEIYFPIGDDPFDEHSQSAIYPSNMVRALSETHPNYRYWEKLP